MNTDPQPIKLVHTPCKSCVFATYDNNIQIGCKLHYLEKYKEQNIEILEVYDNDKAFFVINNKKCIGFRNEDWKIKQINQDINSLKQKLIEESRISYIAIINLNNNDTIHDIENSINSLLSQMIPPEGILFYKKRWEEYIVSNENLLNLMCKYNIKWRIQNFIDKDMNDNDRIVYVLRGCPIQKYFYLIDVKNAIPKNCIQNIQQYLDSKIKSIGCISIYSNLFFPGTTFMYCYQHKLNLVDNKIDYETIN